MFVISEVCQLVLSCPLRVHSAVNDIEDEGTRALAQTLLVNTSVNAVNLAGAFRSILH